MGDLEFWGLPSGRLESRCEGFGFSYALFRLVLYSGGLGLGRTQLGRLECGSTGSGSGYQDFSLEI